MQIRSHRGSFEEASVYLMAQDRLNRDLTNGFERNIYLVLSLPRTSFEYFETNLKASTGKTPSAL